MKKLVTVVFAIVALTGACADADDGSSAAPSPTAPGTGSGTCPDLTGSEPVAIVEIDNAFEPACIVMSASQGLSISNDGQALHNFSIDGADVDLDTQVGQETNTEAIGGIAAPGTYEFFCKYHRDLDMEGTITIQA